MLSTAPATASLLVDQPRAAIRVRHLRRRTVQQSQGHDDVSTAMIDSRILDRGWAAVHSPIDRLATRRTELPPSGAPPPFPRRPR